MGEEQFPPWVHHGLPHDVNQDPDSIQVKAGGLSSLRGAHKHEPISWIVVDTLWISYGSTLVEFLLDLSMPTSLLFHGPFVALWCPIQPKKSWFCGISETYNDVGYLRHILMYIIQKVGYGCFRTQ